MGCITVLGRCIVTLLNIIFLYGFIVTVLLVEEIIAVILMFAPPKIIQGVIKGVLLESVKQYKGISGTDVVTLSWMFVMQEGCYDAVWNTVLGNPIWAGIGFGAGFTFQLLLIIVSILLYIYMRNENNGKVYPDK